MNNHNSEKANRRLGKGMMIAAWVLTLGLLTLFFNGVLDDQYNPNRQLNTVVTTGEPQEVVLVRNKFGHYVATGAINGEAVVFMLDTGATDVAVPLALANRLNLERGAEAVFNTANGKITAWRTRLERVTLGGIELTNVRGSILPSMGGDEVLLGMSFLKHLELVQRGNTLTIRQGM
ncbi:MAG: TIGR02281 family clan AA aspartic protease [Candidatus Polarisedimenticolaceae bacterium]|nr:TIGR02281 family clan AA aspartic protease [Candidatus Polarisedimenticolaceae bacterium]